MKKSLFTFGIILLSALGLAFAIHLLVLNYYEQPLWENLIIPSYIFNFSISFISFWVLVNLKPKWIANMGYIFMAASLLKFLIFFIAFYPSYQSDGEMSKLEFFAFFIPYSVGLILETTSLIQRLNKA
jgi:hypothetical protein|tara:strand:- start:38 stop:421 length:384 start_codon:yes stop_codon:yes gene_type:complete